MSIERHAPATLHGQRIYRAGEAESYLQKVAAEHFLPA